MVKIKNIVRAKEVLPEKREGEVGFHYFIYCKGFDTALTAVEELELGGNEHEMASIMQNVDFDIEDVVVLEGKKYKVLSISAGVKLATAIISQMDKWVRIGK